MVTWACGSMFNSNSSNISLEFVFMSKTEMDFMSVSRGHDINNNNFKKSDSKHLLALSQHVCALHYKEKKRISIIDIKYYIKYSDTLSPLRFFFLLVFRDFDSVMLYIEKPEFDID